MRKLGTLHKNTLWKIYLNQVSGWIEPFWENIFWPFSGPNRPFFWWLPNIEQNEAEHPSRIYQFRSPRSRRTVLSLPKHDCRLSIGWDSGQERHLISGSQFVGLIKGSCDQCGSMWSDQHNEPVCDLHNRIITHLSPTCPGADTNSIVKTVATSWGWGWNHGVPELQDEF